MRESPVYEHRREKHTQIIIYLQFISVQDGE